MRQPRKPRKLKHRHLHASQNVAVQRGSFRDPRSRVRRRTLTLTPDSIHKPPEAGMSWLLWSTGWKEASNLKVFWQVILPMVAGERGSCARGRPRPDSLEAKKTSGLRTCASESERGESVHLGTCGCYENSVDSDWRLPRLLGLPDQCRICETDGRGRYSVRSVWKGAHAEKSLPRALAFHSVELTPPTKRGKR